MRLAIMTTTWKRRELTKAVMAWWAGLESEGVKMWGVSAGDYLPLEHDSFWTHHGCPNEPLGYKHNFALRQAKCCMPDAVMVIGSDDIVEPDLLTLSVKAIEAGAMWTQPKDVYLYEPLTERVARPAKTQLTGAGRVYSRRLLDVLDWHLWPDDATSKLDGKAQRQIEVKMRSMKVVWGDAHKGYLEMIGGKVIDAAVLDIKTDVNMWPYDDACGITAATQLKNTEILEQFQIERLAYGR